MMECLRFAKVVFQMEVTQVREHDLLGDFERDFSLGLKLAVSVLEMYWWMLP